MAAYTGIAPSELFDLDIEVFNRIVERVRVDRRARR